MVIISSKTKDGMDSANCSQGRDALSLEQLDPGIQTPLNFPLTFCGSYFFKESF